MNTSDETHEPEDRYTVMHDGFLKWVAVVPCLNSFFEFTACTRRGAVKQADFFVNNLPVPRPKL